MMSRLKSRPHLIDGAVPGFLLFGLSLHVPGADAQEAEHVHLVNLPHPPAALEQRVIGRIDEVRQRQGFTGVSVVGVSVFSSAAFVGNSSRISVVWV